MKSRFLAIVVSIVMVCVAVAIRSRIDTGGSSSSSSPPATGPVVIACVTELATECSALTNVEVHIEDAAVTAKAIANGTAHIDGWVTFDPWPEIVNTLAGRGVTGDTNRVASSSLVIAMVQERADALAVTCGGTVDWKCLGNAIGKQWTDVGGQAQWGTVKAGIPPATSGLGLLILGNAAADYFNRTDFATNDFDDAFTVWRSSVTATPAAFADFIIQFPALFSAVGTTEQIAAGKGSKPVAEIAPSPSASATVVITAIDSKRAQGQASALGKVLRDEGWGAPAPQSNGLPNAGVLLALSGLK